MEQWLSKDNGRLEKDYWKNLINTYLVVVAGEGINGGFKSIGERMNDARGILSKRTMA